MPVMDGYTATNQIRDYLYTKDLIQPIIIAVTGHVEQSYIRKAYMNGMNQVVSKPINDKLL
jgi:CheY-like chemotaxis protein